LPLAEQRQQFCGVVNARVPCPHRLVRQLFRFDVVGARPWNTARLVKLTPARRGIRRLPTTPAESTDSLAADSVLREALGPALIDSVLAVRESEIELFAEAPAEEVVQTLRWTH